MKQTKITTISISSEEFRKIMKDLTFIRNLANNASDSGCRVVVSGGYAVDGLLGKITRPHRDVDIQIYSQEKLNEALLAKLINESKSSESSNAQVVITNVGRQTYSHYLKAKGNKFLVDIHYIQVTDNPFNQEKVIIKNDESVTDKHAFDTLIVTLEGVSFEVTNAAEELANKRFRREVRKDAVNPVHDQDMHNLKSITNLSSVESKLNEIIRENYGKV